MRKKRATFEGGDPLDVDQERGFVQSKKGASIRLHVHGQADEYIAPVDRHRIPNSNWFEDYAPELTQYKLHTSTYINGSTLIKLPLGKVYFEESSWVNINHILLITL